MERRLSRSWRCAVVVVISQLVIHGLGDEMEFNLNISALRPGDGAVVQERDTGICRNYASAT